MRCNRHKCPMDVVHVCPCCKHAELENQKSQTEEIETLRDASIVAVGIIDGALARHGQTDAYGLALFNTSQKLKAALHWDDLATEANE